MDEGSLANVKFLDKVRWSLPWLARYPFWRMRSALGTAAPGNGAPHFVFLVSNHYEPGLGPTALKRVEEWYKLARATGDAVRDHDGTPFRHTNFFPAEQYERPLLDMLAAMQKEGLGEVEIHLHHGIQQPDTAENTRKILEWFRDTLAYEHGLLSRESPDSLPKYAFVHGNWALANSAGGNFCGVDSEMQILADTGCYADFTLPSVPHQSQVARINAIYQCGRPLSEAKPHRSGPSLKVGDQPALPVIFTGPLTFNWSRRIHGLPVPRLEDGVLAENYPLTIDRFKRWRKANISVEGGPEWVFIKLYCHGFFERDQDVMLGDQMRRFMGDLMDLAERSGEFKIHFASSREAFNMVMAAVDGKSGNPNAYRDYKLRQIMDEPQSAVVDKPQQQLLEV